MKIFKKSVKNNIQLSLIVFTAITIILLWIFQIVLLDPYYHYMQKNAITTAGNEISTHIYDENLSDYLASICYRNDTSALIITENGVQIAYSDMQGKKSYIRNMRPRQLLSTFSPVVTGEVNEILVETLDGESIVYAKRVDTIDNGKCLIIISAQLEPVESTRGILKSQLLIISVALIFISVVISSRLSDRLTEPIKDLSKKTLKLAKGDYRADYTGFGLEETEELADALNYASNGLSKVEDLRRELVANVSHDLKTPLTMIRAYSEMIRDLTGDDLEKRTEQLNVIIDETNRLTTLVNDVIRVSKNEIEKIDLEPETINIKEIIKTVTDRFADTLKEYNFITEYSKEENVLADKKSTEQVIYNLISNAINYTGEDHKIIVRTIEKEKNLRIEIEDSGIGIPKEKIPLIWERYYRSNNTHSRPVAGSGLGLSIVKGALEKQDFPYGVESEVGKGSIFWFECPIAK